MKGDNTRSTFDKKKHYSSVRMQQGRVQLDADWNEQVGIAAHRVETETVDSVGHCGAPMHHGGFHLVAEAGDLTEEEQKRPENQNPPELPQNDFYISGGRYYVDGILCENEHIVPFTKQPDVPLESLPNDFPNLEEILQEISPPEENGTYLAYLDVWIRHITALEDPGIREVALGGPDTATRTKTIWQVKLLHVGGENADVHCLSDVQEWNKLVLPPDGKLAAKGEESEEEDKPCDLAPGAGYRRLENQLYRVEVHKGGNLGVATFKWSRDNGSIVSKWEKQDTNDLTVSSAGRDKVLNFASGQWVELTDDTRELLSKPGILVQLSKVEGQVLTIDPNTIIDPDDPSATSVDRTAFPNKPKIRRWDSDGLLKPTNSQWKDLEDGVQVQFADGSYKTGDYWLIPARTATADVEWPLDENNEPELQAPHGIEHHYCRLALIRFDGTQLSMSDCRNIFPPVTELTDLFYISGDGQEAMPGELLRKPLQVGVSNGKWPVPGTKVRFERLSSGGTIQAGSSQVVSSSADELVVLTGTNGVAECKWQLDSNVANLSQQVEATLLDAASNPVHLPIRFTANLSVADQVAYNPEKCSNLSGVTSVQEAIDVLCQIQPGGGCCVTVGQGGEYERLDEALKALLEKGQRDICICLLPGDHPLPGLELAFPVEKFELHLKIVGCGLGSRVFLEQPLRFTGVKAFTLRDVVFELRFLAEGTKGAISLDRCSEVTLTACHVTGFTTVDDDEAQGTLLSITNADRIRLRDNVIEAALINSFEPTRWIFEQAAEVDFLIELFSLPEQEVFEFETFRLTALESAHKLANLDAETRKKINEALQAVLDNDQLRTVLSIGELFSFTKFNAALIAEAPQPEDLFNDLIDIRRAAIKSRPGVAVVLGPKLQGETPQVPELVGLDEDDYATLESNELIGILSLYGMPAPADIIAEIFKDEFLKQLEIQLNQRKITLTGMLGTLQVRGNQLVQIAVASDIIEQLQKLVGDGKGTLFKLFGRCLMSDNVIEGANSVLVTQHLAMTANEFTLRAMEITSQHTVAIVVADSSIYVGNHGRNVGLRNASRVNSQAANLEITIT